MNLSSNNELFIHLGYSFNDITLLNRAQTHRSYSHDNNERLEFLGDALIDVIIAETLYRQFPEKPEGELSRYRAELVRSSTLADIGREISLNKFINLGEGERKAGGVDRESIISGAFEALIGAIYLDSHFEQCKIVTLHLFQSRLNSIQQLALKKDAKTSLQELMQSQNQELPVYTLVKTSGQHHDQIFTISCKIKKGNKIVEAQGTSKKNAEQSAAQCMLDLLEQVSK